MVELSDLQFDVDWTTIDMIGNQKLETEEKEKVCPTIVAAEIVGCGIKMFPKCVSCSKQVTGLEIRRESASLTRAKTREKHLTRLPVDSREIFFNSNCKTCCLALNNTRGVFL